MYLPRLWHHPKVVSHKIAAAMIVAALVASPSVSAQEVTPDSVPRHDTLTVTSRALGETRRSNVHTPPGYASSPRSRFPVLYMPDGGLDEDFPHIVNTVDSLIALGRIRPVIVVGIPNTERRRDLTGPTRVAKDSTVAPHVGGSAAFRRFIRDELIPAIDARYRTTTERAIIGESLAGLFVVETFLREPTLFDEYIAFDPSLWWNQGALVDSAPALVVAPKSGSARQTRARRPHRRTIYFAGSRDEIGTQTARLAATLRAVAPRDISWTYVARPDLTHATIFRALAPAAIAQVLRQAKVESNREIHAPHSRPITNDRLPGPRLLRRE
jgi:predicted alpha/beta superfamily hydrolase